MSTKTTNKKKITIEEDSPTSEDKNKLFPLEPGFTRVKIESTSGSTGDGENVSGEKSLTESEPELQGEGEEEENGDEEILELESDFIKVKDKCDDDRYSRDCNNVMLKKERI